MTQSLNPPRVPFTSAQKKILLALAGAVGLRMLGLFLVLPVFTLYGLQFTASRFLVGFAFGCYGLAMACTEMPLGRLSDRIGRRKVLLIGMSIFSLGSFLCAVPGWFPRPLQIGELILGRLVQGIGAITATAFAAVSDHIPPERRSTAMAILGIPIGASFILGVIAGPMIAGYFQTEASLFWLTGFLGLATVGLLARYLPDIPARTTAPGSVSKILRLPSVLVLDVSGFLMNTFMTAFWFYFPLIARDQLHLNVNKYHSILIPMLLVSAVTMFGFSSGADRGWGRQLSALAFSTMLVSAFLLFHPAAVGLDPSHLAAFLLPGTLFLVGFTGLEPILPSLVSKAVPESDYGTALGSFHTLQYLGSSVGANLAGALAPFYLMATLMAASLGGVLLVMSSRQSAGPRASTSGQTK